MYGETVDRTAAETMWVKSGTRREVGETVQSKRACLRFTSTTWSLPRRHWSLTVTELTVTSRRSWRDHITLEWIRRDGWHRSLWLTSSVLATAAHPIIINSSSSSIIKALMIPMMTASLRRHEATTSCRPVFCLMIHPLTVRRPLGPTELTAGPKLNLGRQTVVSYNAFHPICLQ